MPRVSVGKSGSIRDHCSSEHQKKSAINLPPRWRQVNPILKLLWIPFMGPDPNPESVPRYSHSCEGKNP
jgi:hypothetical protein